MKEGGTICTSLATKSTCICKTSFSPSSNRSSRSNVPVAGLLQQVILAFDIFTFCFIF